MSLVDPGKREQEQKLRLDGWSYLVATPAQQRELGGGRAWQVVEIGDQDGAGFEDSFPVRDDFYSEGAGFTFEGIDGVYELARGWDASAPGKIGTWPAFADGEETESDDYKGWLIAHEGYLYMLRGRYVSKYALDELQFGVELAKVGSDHDRGAGMAVGGEPLSVNGKLLVPVIEVATGTWQEFALMTAVGSPDTWDASVSATLVGQCFTAWKQFVAMAMDGNQVRTVDPLADMSDSGNWAPAISGDGNRIGPEGSVITELYVHGVYLIAVTDRGVFYMDESYEVRSGIPDIAGWADSRMGVGGGYANGQLIIPTRGGPVRWAPDGDWSVIGPQMEGALEGDLTPGWGRVSGVANYGQWTFLVTNDHNGVAALWSLLPPRSSRVPYVPHSHQQEEDALFEDVAVVLASAEPLQRYAFGTLSDDAAVGSVAWSNPSNAGADDGSYATAEVGTTHYLKGVNPAPALPADATLLGVELVVKRSAGAAS